MIVAAPASSTVFTWNSRLCYAAHFYDFMGDKDAGALRELPRTADG